MDSTRRFKDGRRSKENDQSSRHPDIVDMKCPRCSHFSCFVSTGIVHSKKYRCSRCKHEFS